MIKQHYYVTDGFTHYTMGDKRQAIRLTQQLLSFINIELTQREIQWYVDNAPNTEFTSNDPQFDKLVVTIERYRCDLCSNGL